MFLRQTPNGEWYVSRITSSNKMGRRSKTKLYRNWWLIKWHGNGGNCGKLGMKSITFPKQFVGKKIRLKVEVMN